MSPIPDIVLDIRAGLGSEYDDVDPMDDPVSSFSPMSWSVLDDPIVEERLAFCLLLLFRNDDFIRRHGFPLIRSDPVDLTEDLDPEAPTLNSSLPDRHGITATSP